MTRAITRRRFTGLFGGAAIIGLSAATAHAKACMSTESKEEIAEGRLRVRTFRDAMGRLGTAYILSLPTPRCLKSHDPEDNVKGARAIHVVSSNERVRRRIGRLVGKRVHARGTVFPRHTANHYAPIVMEITEIDEI